MNDPGRFIRALSPIVLAVLLVLGTWVGEDDNFPFGPFRMYSTKQELDGEIRVLQLWGLSSEGEWTSLLTEDFGLRRADLEGQIGKLAEEPAFVLAELADSYERRHGTDLPFLALELREKIYELEQGRPVRDHLRVLGTWRAP